MSPNPCQPLATYMHVSTFECWMASCSQLWWKLSLSPMVPANSQSQSGQKMAKIKFARSSYHDTLQSMMAPVQQISTKRLAFVGKEPEKGRPHLRLQGETWFFPSLRFPPLHTCLISASRSCAHCGRTIRTAARGEGCQYKLKQTHLSFNHCGRVDGKAWGYMPHVDSCS